MSLEPIGLREQKTKKKTKKKKKAKKTYARLGQWGPEQDCAYREAGESREETCLLVDKKDGTHPALSAMDAAFVKKAAGPG